MGFDRTGLEQPKKSALVRRAISRTRGGAKWTEPLTLHVTFKSCITLHRTEQTSASPCPPPGRGTRFTVALSPLPWTTRPRPVRALVISVHLLCVACCHSCVVWLLIGKRTPSCPYPCLPRCGRVMLAAALGPHTYPVAGGGALDSYHVSESGWCSGLVFQGFDELR